MEASLVEAYKWLSVAQLGRFNPAGPELKACAALMTTGQIAEAEAWVDKVREKHRQRGTVDHAAPGP